MPLPPHEDGDEPRSALPADRVLLVDGDTVARTRTAAALAAHRWRVIEASDGVGALQAFAAEPPDAVVLDARPGADGFIVCEHLRRVSGGQHVPVLMLTAPGDDAAVARAYDAGATDFQVRSESEAAVLPHRLRYLLRAAREHASLDRSHARLACAQRLAGLGHWEWDLASRSARLSEVCCAIAGLPPQDRPMADWLVWARVDEDERARIEVLYQDAVAGGGRLDFDCRLTRPSGDVRVVHVDAEVERDAGGRPSAMRGVVQDVTERRHAEDRIRELADFDSLTGLPNRRYFRDQFAASLARARAAGTAVGVLFIDLDRFKRVNDTLGHQVGDELLRSVARRILQCVRESDTVAVNAGTVDAGTVSAQPGPPTALPTVERTAGVRPSGRGNSVARLGGDEFTILLTDLTDVAPIETVAQRLLESMRRPFRVAGHELRLTISIGVAAYPADGTDVDTLLRKADIAMYAVKDSGRDGVLRFSSGMRAAASGRRRLETALRRALDRGELVLYYQPKVDVVDGAVIGAEALMRWRRGGELVPPGEFIAVAEESGLIVPITEWAVREVCLQVARWKDAGMAPVPMSVNISGRHLQRANLLEPVEAALRGVTLDPALLELELTEAVLMHDVQATRPLLQALKRLGVSIAVDDFGTGYSSLAHLTRLPIDALKIDQSFVAELETAPESGAIVDAIVAMGRSLGLRVVAEGVETQGQRARLVGHGCHLMQGFLFSPAVPGDDFPALTRAAMDGAHWRAPETVLTPAAGACGP